MKALKAQMQLTGLDEYLEKLQRAGANIEKVASEAVQESAKPIFNDIKAWAEKHRRTGSVADAVMVSPVQNDGGKIYVEIGIDGDAPGKSEAWHAVFVEYGTARQTADPGIRNAFKNNKAKVRKIQRQILGKGGLPND